MNWRPKTVAALIVILSLCIGAAASEIASRLYLAFLWEPAEAATGRFPKEIPIYDQQRWRYDEKLGYRHLPNLRLHLTSLRDGKVFGCRTFLETDGAGRVRSFQPVDNPDLRIAIFGDSWTSFTVEGKTYGDYIARYLSNALGRSVAILNYGQGGMSIAQMFEFAADVAETERPSAVLINFISDSLDRAKRWQLQALVDGEPRALISPVPAKTADLATMVDSTVIEPRATPQWCLSTMGQRDGVVERSEEKYRQYVTNARPVLVRRELLSPRRSFLYERIRSGLWFRGNPPVLKPATNSRFSETDFRKLPGFSDGVRRLGATGIPYHLFHLPTPRDVEAGTVEKSLTPGRHMLLRSLQEATGHRILAVLDQMQKDGVDAKLMPFSDTNSHPSAYGMEKIGKAIADTLVERRLIVSSTN